jgi:chitinase
LELIFQKVAIDTINTIEEITRGQRGNPEWFNFRRGRINASLFPSVANFGFSDNPDNYIVKQIMNENKDLIR